MLLSEAVMARRDSFLLKVKSSSMNLLCNICENSMLSPQISLLLFTYYALVTSISKIEQDTPECKLSGTEDYQGAQ